SFDRDPVTRGPTVEISHEALLTEWSRLRGWIDGARHDVRNQRRLAEAMVEWVAADRSDEYLLRGGRLDQLHGWATTTSLPLSEPERAFLDASIAERDRAADEEREREERALDAARRERQRARQLVAAGVVAALVAGLAVFGVVQWRSAEDSRVAAEGARGEAESQRFVAEEAQREAEAARAEIEDLRIVNSLASASSVVRSDNPSLALQLAAQALRESARLGFAPDEAVDAVHWALQELGAQYDVPLDTPVAVRSGPNGPSGVYALSPAELVDVAESFTSGSLTGDLCESVYGGSCPDLPTVPLDLPLAGGMAGYGAVAPDQRSLDGATIQMAAMFLINEPGFEAELAAFTEATGIEIELTRYDGNAWSQLLTGDIPRPDVLVFPGALPEWAEARALDLAAWLDHGALRADFGDYLLNAATFASGAARQPPNQAATSVPIRLDLGSMVYYPKAAFEAAGYVLPTTWDELIALSRRMVDDGRTPWCLGFAHAGSARVDGWPATDMIQDLVLRTGGVDAYDEWAAGRIGFSSPQVLEAGRLADELVFEPGFVTPPPDELARWSWLDQTFAMMEPDPSAGEPPSCWFSPQRSFVMRLYAGATPNTVIGTEIDYFLLPPVDAGIGSPIVGDVTLATGLTDRPEVRRLLEHLADPSFGSLWAPHVGGLEGPPPANGFLPANRRFDLAAFGPETDPFVAVKRRMTDDLWSALDAGTLRGAVADVMPTSIGGRAGTRQNAFNAGMIEWVTREKSIAEVFAAIDAEWEAVKLRGEG
ncbi:MAG: carbohydrate ABC transporter substrate-binding protein, partial [Ilumatobacter sp.]|nr:carbohydrate ABC transporter substrate-binding protein [Ilumatobacter sp.]